MRDQHGDLRLLFVAHRQEILRQSVGAFRQVLRSGDFGELYVDGHRPDEWRHVFASIQSLAQVDLAQLDPAAFDVVIVDEFHHAAAPTYRRLLEHLFGGAKADSARRPPRILLGLTATPERTDAEDILHYFDNHIAVEVRLWDALERSSGAGCCPYRRTQRPHAQRRAPAATAHTPSHPNAITPTSWNLACSSIADRRASGSFKSRYRRCLGIRVELLVQLLAPRHLR